MKTLKGYSKIYNLGNSLINNLLKGDINVEEKLDGSQISFGVIDGNLVCRSKSADLYFDKPEKLFSQGLQSIKKIESLLTPNWIYRGEYFSKPKHNALIYDRIPTNNIILFEVETEDSCLSYEEKAKEASRIGLEVVPLVFQGKGDDLTIADFNKLIDRVSILGNVKIEGVVIKNYSVITRDEKVMMGKHVSESFKEVHKHDFKKSATPKDIIVQLIEAYKSKARWQKAIQHLNEVGQISFEPKDIGILIKEIQRDVEEECKDEIKEKLWDFAQPYIMKGIIDGFPQYYKDKLVEKQFDSNVEV